MKIKLRSVCVVLLLIYAGLLSGCGTTQQHLQVAGDKIWELDQWIRENMW